jgi:protein-disulfide isomerase
MVTGPQLRNTSPSTGLMFQSASCHDWTSVIASSSAYTPMTLRFFCRESARASECAADQVDFFAYKGQIYSDPSDLSDARLSADAVALGANKAQFDACAAGSSKAARVQQDVASGIALGVSATPTFFVNGEKFTGFKTAAEFGAILDNKLGN